MANSKSSDKNSDEKRRYIRSFTIQNVRTFRSPVTLDFCREDGKIAQWTVILGDNGTGKTSILQYLAGMTPVQSSDVVIAQDAKKEGAEPSFPPFRPLIGGQDWLLWNALNLPRPWNKPAILHAKVILTKPSALIDCATRDPVFEKNALQLTLTFGETENSQPQIQAKYTISADLKFASEFRIYGYGAGRHVAGPASPYLSSEAFSRNGENSLSSTLFRDDHPLISPEQWLLSLDHTSHSDGPAANKARRISENVRRCLARVLPGIIAIRVRPFGLFESSPSMTLMCETQYGVVPFGALSLGYRTMAAWLIDFLKRMYDEHPTADTPNIAPAVILIDEFDLHMHPSWQRRVIQALSEEFPNTQFIVTAHSPLVVQATEGHAKIVVLRQVERNDGRFEVTADSNPKFTAGWRIDQILESDLYNMNARSGRYSSLMEERVKLRQKDSLTSSERTRLAELEKQLDMEAPPGLGGSSLQLLNEIKEALQAGKK